MLTHKVSLPFRVHPRQVDREECLNMDWFRSRIEARIQIEIWRRLQ